MLHFDTNDLQGNSSSAVGKAYRLKDSIDKYVER